VNNKTNPGRSGNNFLDSSTTFGPSFLLSKSNLQAANSTNTKKKYKDQSASTSSRIGRASLDEELNAKPNAKPNAKSSTREKENEEEKLKPVKKEKDAGEATDQPMQGAHSHVAPKATGPSKGPAQSSTIFSDKVFLILNPKNKSVSVHYFAFVIFSRPGMQRSFATTRWNSVLC
jgi:hypothetical protein